MIRILIFFLVVGITNISFGGIFGRRNVSQPYYPQYYYYYPHVVQEHYEIPVREQKIAEVKGLRVLTTDTGNKYYELNGKLFSSPPKVIEEVTESKQNNKIIIDRKVIQ